MPLEPYQKHLLIIEDDRGSCTVTLENREYSIGRDRQCDIRLASLFVSRHHATLLRVSTEKGTHSYRIVDGKLNGPRSVNGLLINGTKLQIHDLEDEDEVVFGPQVRFTYHLLKRDPDITDPPDDLDPVTLINPRTAGQGYAKEASPDFFEFPWRKASRRCHVIGKRRQFFNFKRRGSLRPRGISRQS